MTNNQHAATEVTLVGGGMVGAALACGLALQGFEVTVIETEAPPDFDPAQPPDLRISAIGAASVDLLRELDAWQSVLAMRAFPYTRLETWEWQSAHLAFDAQSLGLPALGYMVENNVLQRALWQRMTQLKVRVISPASVAMLARLEQGWMLTLDDGSQLQTQLVVAADGANSRVRQLAGIGIQGWQYAQSCMLISVRCEQPPGMATWQQFTPQGPRALLPLFDNWASLVWYDAPARIRQLQAMSMAQLEKEIQREFPDRLGKVTPLAAGSFPLVRRHAKRYVLPGLALVGDAAHTINPLAGQGVNLGYRDVNALIDVLSNARNSGQAWSSDAVLQRYERRRRYDNLLMQSSMDLFYLAFSNRSGPLRIARNLGLLAAEHSGVLKRQALKYALGL